MFKLWVEGKLPLRWQRQDGRAIIWSAILAEFGRIVVKKSTFWPRRRCCCRSCLNLNGLYRKTCLQSSSAVV